MPVLETVIKLWYYRRSKKQFAAVFIHHITLVSIAISVNVFVIITEWIIME